MYGLATNRHQYRIDQVHIIICRVLALKNDNIMQWLLKQMHRNEFYLKVINFTFSIDMFYSMCLTENYQNKPKSNSVLL